MLKKTLIREQLDSSLKQLRPLADQPPPVKGWVRTIRDALGMTARQLASRLGVAQQAVSRIEKQEKKGGVTFKTMRRIGEALDCDFVYGFVPRTSLEETVVRQARKVAIQRFDQATQSMGPEKQALSDDEKEKVLSTLIEALVKTLPSTFWDRPD